MIYRLLTVLAVLAPAMMGQTTYSGPFWRHVVILGGVNGSTGFAGGATCTATVNGQALPANGITTVSALNAAITVHVDCNNLGNTAESFDVTVTPSLPATTPLLQCCYVTTPTNPMKVGMSAVVNYTPTNGRTAGSTFDETSTLSLGGGPVCDSKMDAKTPQPKGTLTSNLTASCDNVPLQNPYYPPTDSSHPEATEIDTTLNITANDHWAGSTQVTQAGGFELYVKSQYQPSGPKITVAPDKLTINAPLGSTTAATGTFTITNSGGGSTDWKIVSSSPTILGGTGGNISFSTSPNQGPQLTGNQSSTVTVTVDTSQARQAGNYDGTIRIRPTGLADIVLPISIAAGQGCQTPQLRSGLKPQDTPSCGDSVSIVNPFPSPSIPLEAGGDTRFLVDALQYNLASVPQANVTLEAWDAAVLSAGNGQPLNANSTLVKPGSSSVGPVAVNVTVPKTAKKIQVRAVMTDAASGKQLAVSPTVDYNVTSASQLTVVSTSIPEGTLLFPGPISPITANVGGAMGSTPQGELFLRLIDGAGNTLGFADGGNFKPGDSIAVQLTIPNATIPDDASAVSLVPVIADVISVATGGTVYLQGDKVGYGINNKKPTLTIGILNSNNGITPYDQPLITSNRYYPPVDCQVDIDSSLSALELRVYVLANGVHEDSTDLGKAKTGITSYKGCGVINSAASPPYAFQAEIETLYGQYVKSDAVPADTITFAIDGDSVTNWVDAAYKQDRYLIQGSQPTFHVPVKVIPPQAQAIVNCTMQYVGESGLLSEGTGNADIDPATGTAKVDVALAGKLTGGSQYLKLTCIVNVGGRTIRAVPKTFYAFVSETPVASGSGSKTTDDGEVTINSSTNTSDRDLSKTDSSSEIQANTPARSQSPQIISHLRNAAAPAGAMAVALSNFIGVAHTIGFDPPIPEDGTFEADLVIHYDPAWFPDDPNFSEANMQMVSLDPATGILYSYPTTIDTQAQTATAHVRGLAAYYSLGVLGPFQQTTLNSPGGGSVSSGAAVVNIGTVDANLQVTGYDPLNGPSPASVVAPAGQQVSSATQTSLAAPQFGWVQARSDQASVRGFALLSQGGTDIDSLPLDNQPGTYLVATAVESGSSLNLMNTTNFPANVSVELHGLDGGLLGTQAIDLDPKGDFSGAVAAMFQNAAAPLQGYLAIKSTVRVAASVVWTSPAALSAVNAVNPDFVAPGAKNYFSPLLIGGGGFTRLNFVNIGNAAANVTIQAFDQAGLPLGQAASMQLASGQQYWNDAAQALGITAGKLTVGSLSIQSDGPLAGDVTLSDSAQLVRTALLLTEPAMSLVIPHVTSGNGQQMVLSVGNPSAAPANVLVQVFGADGSATGSVTLPIAAQGRTTVPLATIVPAAAAQIGGHIQLDGTQGITALALIGALTLDRDVASIPAQTGLGAAVQIPSPNPPVIDAPDTIDFGAVTLGQTISPRTFTLGNKGAGTLTVLGLTAPSAPFSLLSPSASAVPFDVPAGGTPFSIGLSPTAAGALADKLVINTNDPVNKAWTMNLKATVTAPVPGIKLNVSSLSFGSVTVGQTPGTQSLTVTNSGGTAVTVTAKTSAPFSVSPASLSLTAGQSGTFTVTFTPTSTGTATGSLTVSIGSPNDPPPVPLSGSGVVPVISESIIRTMGYHEITRFTKDVRFGNQGMPVLSSSGNRIVYANAPGDETDARYNDIFVINADGSGQRLVDSYKQNCFCGALVDISADGSSVVSTDGVELRIASATGSTGKRLITNREIPYVRISPKGDKVFFVNRRGEATATDATTERGLYVINADGTGLKQITGPKAVAALFGLTPDQVFPFATDGWSLDVSADGARTVFGVATPAGERILAVNADGTSLKQLLGPFNFVVHAGLSGDGSKVAYDVIPPPCCSTPNEVGVVNYDGSGRKALGTNVGGLDSNQRMEISGDGSQLLYGSRSYLYATDGSGVLQLASKGGYFSSDSALLVGEGFGLPTMNSAANRFLYVSADDSGVAQLATLDINPSTLGEAPSITAPALIQPSIALNGTNQATVSAKVTTANKVTRVSAAVLNAGITDVNVNAPVMQDNGTSGDQVSGDGIYTSNQVSANCCAVLGPKNVRVKAEVRDTANRRHATAIEFGGLTVVSK